jgi:hypothetical protein
MLDYLWLLILYYIYLSVENVQHGFMQHQIIEYIHDRNIELKAYNVLDVIPNNHYYFHDEYSNIELRAPIFIPMDE